MRLKLSASFSTFSLRFPSPRGLPRTSRRCMTTLIPLRLVHSIYIPSPSQHCQHRDLYICCLSTKQHGSCVLQSALTTSNFLLSNTPSIPPTCAAFCALRSRQTPPCRCAWGTHRSLTTVSCRISSCACRRCRHNGHHDFCRRHRHNSAPAGIARAVFQGQARGRGHAA